MDTQRDTVMEESLCALVAMTGDQAAIDTRILFVGMTDQQATAHIVRAVVRELGKNGMLVGGRDALPDLWVGLTGEERTADW